MGADGWIYVLDGEKVEELELDPEYDFRNAYERTIFGRTIWTVYWDTEDHDLSDYSRGGLPEEYAPALIDEWEVWT